MRGRRSREPAGGRTGPSGPETPAGGTGPKQPENSSVSDRPGRRGRATEARAVLGMAPCYERGWVGHMIRSDPFPVPGVAERASDGAKESSRPLAAETAQMARPAGSSRDVPVPDARTEGLYLRATHCVPASGCRPPSPLSQFRPREQEASELIALFLIPEPEQIAALVEVLRPPRGQEQP